MAEPLNYHVQNETQVRRPANFQVRRPANWFALIGLGSGALAAVIACTATVGKGEGTPSFLACLALSVIAILFVSVGALRRRQEQTSVLFGFLAMTLGIGGALHLISVERA